MQTFTLFFQHIMGYVFRFPTYTNPLRKELTARHGLIHFISTVVALITNFTVRNTLAWISTSVFVIFTNFCGFSYNNRKHTWTATYNTQNKIIESTFMFEIVINIFQWHFKKKIQFCGTSRHHFLTFPSCHLEKVSIFQGKLTFHKVLQNVLVCTCNDSWKFWPNLLKN